MLKKFIYFFLFFGASSNSFGMTELAKAAGFTYAQELHMNNTYEFKHVSSGLKTAGGLIKDLSIGGLKCVPNLSNLPTLLCWGALIYTMHRLNRAENKLDNIEKVSGDTNQKVTVQGKKIDDINKVTQETQKKVEGVQETVTKTDKTVREMNHKITGLEKATNDIGESVEDIKGKLNQHGIHFDTLLQGQKAAEKQVSQVQKEQGKMQDAIGQVAEILKTALEKLTGLGTQVGGIEEEQKKIYVTMQKNHQSIEKIGKECLSALEKNNDAIGEQNKRIDALESTVKNAGFQLSKLQNLFTITNNRAITTASSTIGIVCYRPTYLSNSNNFGGNKYSKLSSKSLTLKPWGNPNLRKSSLLHG